MMSSSADAGTERGRIRSIDILRGIIMVVMALDHTRDFFHTDALLYSPTDLSKSHLALFFTRWITHFCMPAFVFLSGTAVRISLQSKDHKQLSAYLLTRGLWMLFLEVVVMRFGYFFNFYFDMTILTPLWTFGTCFIILSLLIYLPERVLLLLGLAITFLHDLVASIPVDPTGWFHITWTILMKAARLTLFPGHLLISTYPLIPWLGIMILGFSVGKLYVTNVNREVRAGRLMQLGTAGIVLFLIGRAINMYGDPEPWNVQANWLFSILSFVNTTKYPVSLLFTMMTLGPLLMMLGALEYTRTKLLNAFQTIGRVPLFFFVVHFYVIHLSALLMFMQKTGRSISEIDFHFFKSFGGITTEGGYSLPWVYVAWICVVLAMYPLCRWYDEYKNKHRYKWMKYL